MNKAEKELYRDKTPIGVYPLSNWGGFAILDIIYGIDDYVVVQYYDISIHRVKIMYTASGRSYFRVGRYRIYLDEVMRTPRGVIA
jgi:hypothetical protein